MSTTTRRGRSTAAVGAADTRTSTIVVAASNSLDPTLAPAAYRCDGVADDVEMNAALVAAAAVNGRVELLEGAYNTVLTLSVAINVALVGNGFGSVINFNAGGNAVTIAGSNVKLRDFKIVIVAGAGAGGTRPNGIFADTRSYLEIIGVWVIGDLTVADDGSDLRQCGIVFNTVTFSKILDSIFDGNDRHSISLATCSTNSVEGNLCANNSVNGIHINLGSYNTVSGNICEGNTGSGIDSTATSYNEISRNMCYSNTVHGMIFYSCEASVVSFNICYLNTQNGIYLNEDLSSSVVGNICEENTLNGIRATSNFDTTFTGNTTRLNVVDGILVDTDSVYCTVTGNTCEENETGIVLTASDYNTVTGNTCGYGWIHGIQLVDSHSNTVTANTCVFVYVNGITLTASNLNSISSNVTELNTEHGILLDDSDNNKVIGNTCTENDVENTGSFDGINITDTSSDNIVHSNSCTDNDRYGINIDDALALRNWIKNNQFQGNTSGPFNDVGTNTKLECIPLYIASYSVTDITESEDGLVIDGAGDWVSFVGQLPLSVQQVMRFEIWGVGLAAPGAGNQMCLEIEIEGGAEDEAKTTHDTGALADQLSVTEATAVDDIIHWVCTHANALALLGGDSVKCACRYNAISGSDIATNAALRRVIAHVV